jgi:predicted RNA binding protein YcfA (HicA-like mRNA interferase family)
MAGLPVLSGKKLLRVLLRHDFVALRKKGSHVFIESADGIRGTVVPVHGNEDLGKGLLKSILNDLNLSIDDLRSMLDAS